MPNLKSLKLKTTYHKGEDDIGAAFYLPCMSNARRYNRAVGFFSSTIYVLAWSALKDFISRDGKMRIICSPVLSADDIAALKEGYTSHTEEKVAQILRVEVERLLADAYLHKPSRVLASLVSLGIVDLKIALVGDEPDQPRLFHDKTGIFSDDDGNVVVFKGSMNETWNGLSNDGNLESIDVFVTWEDIRETQRVQDEVAYFESLWENRYPRTEVRPFPKVALEEFARAADSRNWSKLLDEICDEMSPKTHLSPGDRPNRKVPRPHQTQAIANWTNHNRRGIFEHATGSGKTFTALCAIRDAIGRNEIPLILVPSEILLNQWLTEIQETLSDLNVSILPCGAGNTKWRDDRLLRPWTRNRQSDKSRIVLSTLQTASSDAFRMNIDQGSHLFLVADEVHRVGSTENRKLLSLETGARLGLSATPRRAGDIEGTAAILAYFDGIIPPPFTLLDAIKSGALTPYFYYVHQVSLSASEQHGWDELTKQITSIAARAATSKSPDPSISDRIKRLLIQRARIVKGASAKVLLALNVLKEQFSPGQKWIIYCDDQNQLTAVLNETRNAGLPSGEYHSMMTGDRDNTLKHFAVNGGILVSIRCLDEGVDIPSVTHALILASSQNPREFIQRRGRVLRRAPNKTLAFLHDAVVVPTSINGQDPNTSILEGEMARAIQFGRNAENPSSITELERIAARTGFDFTKLTDSGYEDDE